MLSRVATVAKCLLILLIACIATSTTSSRLLAVTQGTDVDVLVCNPSNGGATITITSPQSDSVVTQSNVTLTGVVTNTTQIVISVDGAYDKTVAIPAGETTFSTQVSIQQGTHTITIEAIDICAIQNATANVVVTYRPTSPPTPDPTPSPDSPDVRDDTVVSPPFFGIPPLHTERTPTLLPGELDILPIDDGVEDPGKTWPRCIAFANTPLINILRIIVFAVGLLLLAYKTKWLRQLFHKQIEFKPVSKREFWLGIMPVRIVGAILIILAFMGLSPVC